MMTEVRRFPDMDQIEREASQWIAVLNGDDVSADDRLRFQAWRKAHSLHDRTYRELSRTWAEFTAAGPLVRAVSFGHEMNDAAKPRHPRLRWWYAAACTVAVVIAG